MNAITYARVSTDRQADKDLSIPAQLEAMRAYAHQRGWTISEEFVEPGASARTTERPMLQRLLARCKQAPKVDVVIVHKVDRLARDVYGHATIKALLRQRGIRLASVVENVDDTITGQLVENIMASIAEFYSANLGEEVKKGMRTMIQRGEWPHQPPRGYLPTRTADNRPLPVPDPVAAPAIVDAFERYATGRFSLREIGEELLIRGVGTATGKPVPLSYVRSMLENPFYIGRMRWNGADYAANHEALISESVFLRVQEMLRYRFKSPGERGRTRYLLRGLATCGECGYRVTAERHGRWAYYRCIQHAHGRCGAPLSNVLTAHDNLLALYRSFRLPAALKAAIRDEVRAECDRRASRSKRDGATLNIRRERLLRKEAAVTESFAAGETPKEAYRTVARKLRAEISAVDERLRETHGAHGDVVRNLDRLLDAANALADLHSTLDLPRQQRLVGLVFNTLVLDRGTIVDYALKPPFDGFFQQRRGGGNGTPSASPHLELPSLVRAIRTLFELNVGEAVALTAADSYLSPNVNTV